MCLWANAVSAPLLHPPWYVAPAPSGNPPERHRARLVEDIRSGMRDFDFTAGRAKTFAAEQDSTCLDCGKVADGERDIEGNGEFYCNVCWDSFDQVEPPTVLQLGASNPMDSARSQLLDLVVFSAHELLEPCAAGGQTPDVLAGFASTRCVAPYTDLTDSADEHDDEIDV